MGKIIKDGFMFVQYANAGLIRKIDDIPELKYELIRLSELKNHVEMADYALLLAEHIMEISGIEYSTELAECMEILPKWQNREVKFQEALEVAGKINNLAREEKDQVKAKALRAMGQIVATPHVRWHPLVASEYAVVMINLLYPEDMEKVRLERELQISMMKNV